MAPLYKAAREVAILNVNHSANVIEYGLQGTNIKQLNYKKYFKKTYII